MYSSRKDEGAISFKTSVNIYKIMRYHMAQDNCVYGNHQENWLQHQSERRYTTRLLKAADVLVEIRTYILEQPVCA
jgi:hypothetical protein